MNKLIKNKIFFLITLILLILVFLFIYRITIKNWLFNVTPVEVPQAVEYKEDKVEEVEIEEAEKIEEIIKEPEIKETKSEVKTILPEEYNLNVPFTSQAPYGIWDETLKEACEETSSLMVDYFFNHQEFTPESAFDDILKMVEWQNINFGGHFDLTALETADMIKQFLGYQKVEVMNNPTIDEIKKHIFEQRPVIIPVAGRLLNNPYFKTPGPIYHMLVIKGYTTTAFITNEPGTKRGKDYIYDYDVIMNAIHSWNETDINLGAKQVIIIYPN